MTTPPEVERIEELLENKYHELAQISIDCFLLLPVKMRLLLIEDLKRHLPLSKQ